MAVRIEKMTCAMLNEGHERHRWRRRWELSPRAGGVLQNLLLTLSMGIYSRIRADHVSVVN
jgi:hypothetical protein